MNSILLVVAQQNPELAARELVSLSGDITTTYRERRQKELAVNNLTESDSANDSKAYEDMVREGMISAPESPDAELLSDAAKVTAKKLGAKDTPIAVAFTEGLEGNFLKLTALTGALESWAVVDPPAAVAYVANKYPSNPELLASAYQGWAAVDPPAAANGTDAIRDVDDRNAVLNSVLEAWSADDGALEAANYIDKLPEEMVNDTITLTVAQGLAYTSPVDAWELAKTIKNPTTQAKGLKAALSSLVFQRCEPGGFYL